jgi:hypothetical protein
MVVVGSRVTKATNNHQSSRIHPRDEVVKLTITPARDILRSSSVALNPRSYAPLFIAFDFLKKIKLIQLNKFTYLPAERICDLVSNQ